MNDKLDPLIIATRDLRYARKDGSRGEVTVCISAPYPLTSDDVPSGFKIAQQDAGCDVVLKGLDEAPRKVVGADSVQAVQLAVNSVDSYLRSMRRRYTFYSFNGEPYFEG